MKIVGTQLANRRRDRRVSVVPIQIEFGGKAYSTVDWSLGGFLVEGYKGRLRRGDEIMIGIKAVAGGVGYSHVARAEVVRIDRMGHQLAANFLGLDAATLATLEGLLTGRLRRRTQHRKAG